MRPCEDFRPRRYRSNKTAEIKNTNLGARPKHTIDQDISMKLSYVIPTKDRPEHLKACLESLAERENRNLIDCVVVVACGRRVDSVLDDFREHLFIRYIHTEKCGHLYQRNVGLRECLDKSEYIGFLDEDVVLGAGTCRHLVDFILTKRAAGITISGVSMNFIDAPSYEEIKFRLLKRALLQIGKKPGVVTVAGSNTTIANISEDLSTEWLGGGCTVWSANVLINHPQMDINTKYAAAEDLIYSFPLHKSHSLYVCAKATCTADYQYSGSRANQRYIAFKQIVAKLYFCHSNKELSVLLCGLIEILTQLIQLRSFTRGSLSKFLGFVTGMIYFFRNMNKGVHVLDD